MPAGFKKNTLPLELIFPFSCVAMLPTTLFKIPLVEVGKLNDTVSLGANKPPALVLSEKFCHVRTVLLVVLPGTVTVSVLVPEVANVANPAVTCTFVAAVLGTVASAN